MDLSTLLPLLLGSVLLGPWLLIRLYAHRLRAANRLRRSAALSALGTLNTEHKTVVGFFHPYWSVIPPSRFRFRDTSPSDYISNAGGGGERVLWTAVSAVQRTEPDIITVIYTGDVDTSKQGILDSVKVTDPLSYRHRPVTSGTRPGLT